jgi:hypothetical protein
LLFVRAQQTHSIPGDTLPDVVLSTMQSFHKKSADGRTQAISLLLIQRLWGVCINVFDDKWRRTVASKLLAFVIPAHSNMRSEGVWSRFCADLALHSMPTSLDVFFEDSVGLDFTRDIWNAVAVEWATPERSMNYCDGVACLLAPLRCV